MYFSFCYFSFSSKLPKIGNNANDPFKFFNMNFGIIVRKMSSQNFCQRKSNHEEGGI
jgi:hypothetical protein